MGLAIRRLQAGEEDAVLAAGVLFDDPPQAEPTRRFLADPGHHLLVAYDGERPVGFVSGVEMTHPDKGTEMFLSELGVDEAFRRRGIGRSLVAALADLARARGCTGMWTATEPGNEAALRTYADTGGIPAPPQVGVDWELGAEG